MPCWLALATPAATCDGLALRGPAGLAYKRSGGAFDASHYSDKALNEDLSLQPSGELWCWRPTGCTYGIYVSLQLRVGGLAAARHQGRSAIAVAVPVPGKVLPVFVLAVIKGMHEPAAQALGFRHALAPLLDLFWGGPGHDGSFAQGAGEGGHHNPPVSAASTTSELVTTATGPSGPPQG